MQMCTLKKMSKMLFMTLMLAAGMMILQEPLPGAAESACSERWHFDQDVKCEQRFSPTSIISGFRRLQSSIHLDFNPGWQLEIAFTPSDHQKILAGGSPISLVIAYMPDAYGEWEIIETTFNQTTQQISAIADRPGYFTVLYPELPQTGFPHGNDGFLKTGSLPQPHKSGDDYLEIPALSLIARISTINVEQNGWDVSNLEDDIGWLEGSTYPGYSGNTVLTGHYWDQDDSPGIFFTLRVLQPGDILYYQSHGQVMEYEVMSSERILKRSYSVNQQIYENQITLITCEELDPETKEFRYIRVVRASLLTGY